MALQRKLLIGCISLIPLGLLVAAISPHFFSETADDAGPGLAMLAGYLLSLIGAVGILVCAIIWKWAPPRVQPSQVPNGTRLADGSLLVTSSVKFVQRLFLFGSLTGLLIGVVMACVPPDLYTTVRDSGDEMTSRLMWVALITLSVSGLVTTAVLYTIKTPEDDDGPLIIRR